MGYAIASEGVRASLQHSAANRRTLFLRAVSRRSDGSALLFSVPQADGDQASPTARSVRGVRARTSNRSLEELPLSGLES